MHIRVAGMVWLPKEELGPEGLVHVRKTLTIVPKKSASYGGDDDVKPEPIRCWVETPTEVAVPRSFFFDSAKSDHVVDWNLAEGRPIRVESKLRQEGPYAEQAVAVQTFLDRFGQFDQTVATGGVLSGLLKAKTGFGKTNTALALIHRLARTTVIIVHKEFLLKQWVRRIEKFLPGARVGVCQGPKCEYEDKDVVVAMAASLGREEGDEGGERYPEEFYRYFGFMIVDEVHRIGAPTWSPIPNLFAAKYRLGLTATPRRKDGADKVFWWHLGQIAYTAKTETPKPTIRMVNLATRGPRVMHEENPPPAMVLKMLSQNDTRNEKIIDEVMAALKTAAQRKVFVLSHFLDHLRVLETKLRGRLIDATIPDVTTSFYVGEWFTEELTFSLLRRKDLSTGNDRETAIDTIYRHFRRQWFDTHLGPVSKGQIAQGIVNWRCAEKFDGKRYVALYKHQLRPVCLDDLADKGLIAMGKDYGIAQSKPELKRRELTDDELDAAERARVIFATYQMCAEGVDIASIDTTVLATPIGDVEQAAGRNRRNCVPVEHGGEMTPQQCDHLCAWRAAGCKGKPVPVIADICDVEVPRANRSKRYRLAYYTEEGFKVAQTKIA